MAALGFHCVSPVVASGTSAKTIVQVVAAANHPVKVKGFSCSCQGTSNTALPVLVELVRQSTAGTSSALTPVKAPSDDSDETLQSTAVHSCTVEPTTGDVLRRGTVHPQTGYTEWFPHTEHIKVGGGDRLGVRVTAAADVNVVAELFCEE